MAAPEAPALLPELMLAAMEVLADRKHRCTLLHFALASRECVALARPLLLRELHATRTNEGYIQQLLQMTVPWSRSPIKHLFLHERYIFQKLARALEDRSP
ncbi:hypothetical protein DFJ74DRAFT_700591 [Hyaloraphidium curvatum]|nr:hypothetical protein DFJ74DRAFT_775825 [Hyaloraphidium curvatum]KAI9034195.1 hypothetical protein DFJ74DRAFT_700591 [Hyaloraphidium curvatum]